MTNLTTLTPEPLLDRSRLEPTTEPFTLGPGDKIELEIVGDPSTRTLLSLGPDGKVYFYVLPGLDLWGLTLPQAREALEHELARYMPPPRVAITLRGVESQRIWLLGRFRNPGVYSMAAPMTLLEAIALAGGFLNGGGPGMAANEDLADLPHSFLIREGEILPVDFQRLIREGDMTQNLYLRPDDFVYVPSAVAHEVYVLGAVRGPRPVAWSESTTLVSVMANVGGTIKDAYLSHVGIVRGSLTQPQLAVIDYKDIVSGRAPDVRLEPRDIVYVPFTPYRTLVKYADLILATFARAVAINEGARAASHDVGPVGLQIGISGVGATAPGR